MVNVQVPLKDYVDVRIEEVKEATRLALDAMTRQREKSEARISLLISIIALLIALFRGHI